MADEKNTPGSTIPDGGSGNAGDGAGDAAAQEKDKELERLRAENQHKEELLQQQKQRASKFENKYKKLRDSAKDKVDMNEYPEDPGEENREVDIKTVVSETLKEERKRTNELEFEGKLTEEVRARTDNEAEAGEILRLARSMGEKDPVKAVEMAVAAYDRSRSAGAGGFAVPFAHAGMYDGTMQGKKTDVTPAMVELGAQMGHTEDELKTKNKDVIDLRTWGRGRR